VLTIGLTGGIGSGKSAVAGILGDLGATILDADKVGHEVYRPGKPGWTSVVEAFGEGVVAADGTIDRRKLGVIVFADAAALRRLNAIVHPLIADEVRARIAELRARGVTAPIVVEAAVLFEAGWDRIVDETWVVVTDREIAIARVMATRGLPRAEVESRIASQLSDAERTRRATVVVRNAGSLESLRETIERVWKDRVERAGSSPAGRA
jgi:dephospho-CoA kinase